jgi:hypothetical protein
LRNTGASRVRIGLVEDGSAISRPDALAREQEDTMLKNAEHIVGEMKGARSEITLQEVRDVEGNVHTLWERWTDPDQEDEVFRHLRRLEGASNKLAGMVREMQDRHLDGPVPPNNPDTPALPAPPIDNGEPRSRHTGA